jgi:NAD(P)-dependent dehydrogenase (short-subunit alcohol dehydrogenase family)
MYPISADSMFAGKVVVITNAGRGLGLGIARRFGQAMAQVVMADKNVEAIQAAAALLNVEGLTASAEQLDICDPAQSLALTSRLVEAHQHIDVWVNTPQVVHQSPAELLPSEAWEESIATMLSGAFYCSQAVGKQMLRQQHGVIINVASSQGYQVSEGLVASCTANAGLIMLTQALGIEWAKRGVRVVGIAPGVVELDGVSQDLSHDPSTAKDNHRRIPMRRMGMAEEIADAALYLASDEASYITAETIRVDGGLVAYQLF